MNIRKSLRQSKQTSLPCNDSEQNTNLGVAVRIFYNPNHVTF